MISFFGCAAGLGAGGVERSAWQKLSKALKNVEFC